VEKAAKVSKKISLRRANPARCCKPAGRMGITARLLHGTLFRTIRKMFHVKHFCPIEAQNLTWRKTAGALDEVRPAKILVRKNRAANIREPRTLTKKCPKM
jgi:hypothetical protein